MKCLVDTYARPYNLYLPTEIVFSAAVMLAHDIFMKLRDNLGASSSTFDL